MSDIYFITDGQYTKIGIAQNVERRLGTMQVGNPKELEVATTVKSTGKTKRLEKALHAYYSQYNVNGEWFDLPEGEVASFILVDKVDPDDVKEVLNNDVTAQGIEGRDTLITRINAPTNSPNA